MEALSDLQKFHFKARSTDFETSFPKQRRNTFESGNTRNRGIGQQNCEWHDLPKTERIIRAV